MQVMQKMQIQSLGQEDPLEEDMATDSSILNWKIPWTESLVGYRPLGSKSLTWLSEWICMRVHTHTHTQEPEMQVDSLHVYNNLQHIDMRN